MQFLRGLNDQCNNIESHILLTNHIPLISKIFSYVIQQERQVAGNTLFFAKTKVNATTVVSCHYCGKNDHTKSVCLRKHGFPQNSKNKDIRNATYKKVCTHCARNGHTIDVCYNKHEYP